MAKELVTLAEFDVPKCSLDYGTSPCQARLGITGASKCYKTNSTCQSPANYTPITLTLRIGSQQGDIEKTYDAIPSIAKIAVTPVQINLGGMDKDRSTFGQREVVTLTVGNHLHSDLKVDDYRLERTFRRRNRQPRSDRTRFPFKQNQTAELVARSAFFGWDDPTLDPYLSGTMWGKFTARNPYYSGSYPARVYEGEMGQTTGQMRVRNLLLDTIDGPTKGSVKLVLKDKFSRVEKRKAVAPKASKGELAADITAVATSFTLFPSGIGASDYPASNFYVCIGDEIIFVTTRTGDVCSPCTRAQLNTLAAVHKDEDLVQLVLVYTSQRAHNITKDLLLNYAGIASGDINASEWDASATALQELYTTYIATPVPVQDLIGELSEQVGFTVYPDPTSGAIKFVAFRAANPVATIDDISWIIDGPTITRGTEKRVSQVWVYYGQINPVESLDDKRNYRSRLVSVDLSAESAVKYGAPAIKEIFSRWIPQNGRSLAVAAGDRVLTNFLNGVTEAKFTVPTFRPGVDAIKLADYIVLRATDYEGVDGIAKSELHAVTSINRMGATTEMETQSVAFTSSGDPNVRDIFIENHDNNVNLRTIHDVQYAAPVGTETITFTVVTGTVIGSTTSAAPAMDVGTWPAGCTIIVINQGRIEGKGGDGGQGGGVFASPGQPGEAGGLAFLTGRAITLNNTAGQIYAGGGGGGGGASGWTNFVGGVHWGGGGGAGAAGARIISVATPVGGTGGPAGGSSFPIGGQNPATDGTTGTIDAAGSPGTGANNGSGDNSGNGGAAGGPAAAGTTGDNTSGIWQFNGSPGAGGAAGDAIHGVGFITFAGAGTILGAQV